MLCRRMGMGTLCVALAMAVQGFETVTASEIVLEAEGVTRPFHMVAADDAGASGGGYLRRAGKDGHARYAVNEDAAGDYEVYLRVRTDGSSGRLILTAGKYYTHLSRHVVLDMEPTAAWTWLPLTYGPERRPVLFTFGPDAGRDLLIAFDDDHVLLDAIKLVPVVKPRLADLPLDQLKPLYDAAIVLAQVIVDPGPDYADEARRFQGIPGIACAPHGRLWVNWYTGGTGESAFNYVLLVTSGDGGKTWSRPKLAVDLPYPLRAFDPTLWVDPLGRLWMFWAQSYDWFDGRAGVWAMVTENPDDEKPDWSAPRRLCHGIMLNKPTVLSSGEWMLPVHCWSLNWVSHPDVSKEELGANVFVSTDSGATWSRRNKVGQSGGIEHMIVERKDGRLWMLNRGVGIDQSFSDDRGVTWSERTKTTIAHNSTRFYIGRLASGNLLLVKHGAIHQQTKRDRLMAFVSRDDGVTWSAGLMLEKGPCSYPDATEGPDGTLYVTYDSNRGLGSIWLAAFTEEDALAGRDVSGNVHLRMLVNQAAGR